MKIMKLNERLAIHFDKDLKIHTETCRRMTLNPSLLPCTKISSKWIKDLNLKKQTNKQKLLEEKTSRYRNRQELSKYSP